ncbi:excalibur calcium-binding domain-containing protein [Sphingomonas limnosediminicola]|uniref:excalibur calcium-binding domain-containing protein n=1 Tax=Sphingomonas limnosediminicola TaxID=940133 RepID=UPI0031E05962
MSIVRTIVLLLSAILLGLVGGYSWSKWSGAVPVQPTSPSAVSKPSETAEELESSVYYADCDAARAAGSAPVMAGRPGYRAELDPDGDGVGCVPIATN